MFAEKLRGTPNMISSPLSRFKGDVLMVCRPRVNRGAQYA